MIFRRYGTRFHSVDLAFDSKSLNEIAFRRNQRESVPAEEMERFPTVSSHELVAEAEGDVQDHTEAELLERLAGQVLELERALTDGEVLVVENDQGHDWPKTRQKTANVVVEGENRLRFHYSVAPPLRVTVRRRA